MNLDISNVSSILGQSLTCEFVKSKKTQNGSQFFFY
jgi:hypothetical protein